MIEFASKQGSRWGHCHLIYNWNMCAFIAPKDCIMRGRAYKVLTTILHTTQVTQATRLPKTKPKIVFNIGCDHLAPNMPIVLSIHALHL
jgi:hypothetical protein